MDMHLAVDIPLGWGYIWDLRLAVDIPLDIAVTLLGGCMGVIWLFFRVFQMVRKPEGRWWRIIEDHNLQADIVSLGAILVYSQWPPEDRTSGIVVGIAGAMFSSAYFVTLSISAVYRSGITVGTLFVFGLRLVELILMFAVIYRITGIAGPGGRAETLGPCLYFSIITITTVGYGDWIPLPQSRAFAAFEALLGYVYMALFIAALISLLNNNPRPKKRRRY